MRSEWRQESLLIAQKIKRYADEKGISTLQFSLAWVLNNRYVTSVIGGPRTLEQWDEYGGGASYAFPAQHEALADRLVTPGHPSLP